MLGSTEIIVLVVVIGVLIFGAKKIPELAKTFGKAKGEFEKGKIQGDKELKDFKGEIDSISKDKEVKFDLSNNFGILIFPVNFKLASTKILVPSGISTNSCLM
jgi:sec-independent protein translocase protein TatA